MKWECQSSFEVEALNVHFQMSVSHIMGLEWLIVSCVHRFNVQLKVQLCVISLFAAAQTESLYRSIPSDRVNTNTFHIFWLVIWM